MRILSWLMAGDPAIRRLVKKELLDQKTDCVTEGWIAQYISLYDHQKKLWGNGIYGPKWVSTFYTVRELTVLEIDPGHPVYQEGVRTLIRHMWNEPMWKEHDLCVVGMLLSMGVYAGASADLINELFMKIVKHQLHDGGFNCECLFRDVKSSSVHTTLTVLEALSALKHSAYPHDSKRRMAIEKQAREFLLRKHLMRRERDGELMFSYIDKFHYPTRWKYDVLRALVYFAKEHVPYDKRMDEALQLLKKRFHNGILPKGPIHTGRTHFPLESEDIKRMNTLHGLIVLKEYDTKTYETMINLTE